jgi:Tol biopolymer transport system component
MGRLTESEYNQAPGSWHRDGETLAFAQWHPDRLCDIMLFHLRDRKVTPFLTFRFWEACPEFSPDGKWIAYVSNESGLFQVYVQPFPGPGGKEQISGEGGIEPLWSRNGKQLFYLRGNQIWVVDVQTGSGFSASKPSLVFEQPGYQTADLTRRSDISLDDQRFLMVKMEERKSQPVTEMILIQNWFEELKRLVPNGKH